MSSARSLRAARRRTALVLAGALLASLLPAGALAQEGPFPSDLSLTPESDTATAGTCNEVTARVTAFGEPEQQPVEGVTIDVTQTLNGAGTEPDEARELAFCDPVDTGRPNPTGQGGTAFGDASGNNPAGAAAGPGRNTILHGEVGPTDLNGEVTFGVTMTPPSSAGQVTVRAWFDFENDDVEDEGDPGATSTKTWTALEQAPVTSLDAGPESASNPNGSRHTVTVTVLSDGTPVQGVVPRSTIAAEATGRPPGDAADAGAGASPNFMPGKSKPGIYACSASTAQGVSTCTFQDSAATGAGTDTIVFFVDVGGEAGEPGPGDPQDAVQKTWFVPGGGGPTPPPVTPEARNIRLCQGSSPAPACNTAPRSLLADNEHVLSVLVTDRGGSPLGDVPVELRHVGPADFVSTGTDTVTLTTGPDGTARAVLASEVEGTSTIVAEISPQSMPGSHRGPGPADDECEQPAGPGGSPPAGNCTSQTLTVVWELSATTPACDDGIDNDGDGYIDFGDDPSCSDENDDSEDPVDAPPSPVAPHDRRINMRFRDRAGSGDEGLVISGRLRLVHDGDDFRQCTQGQPVRIQRLVDGEWVTRKRTTTNSRGRYAGVVFDKPGPYRAVAPRTQMEEDEVLHVCRRAEKEKTHHHRR